MYLVLKQNGDPYCGGDYEFCETIDEVVKLFSYEEIFHVYKIDKERDMYSFFKRKYNKVKHKLY